MITRAEKPGKFRRTLIRPCSECLLKLSSVVRRNENSSTQGGASPRLRTESPLSTTSTCRWWTRRIPTRSAPTITRIEATNPWNSKAPPRQATLLQTIKRRKHQDRRRSHNLGRSSKIDLWSRLAVDVTGSSSTSKSRQDASTTLSIATSWRLPRQARRTKYHPSKPPLKSQPVPDCPYPSRSSPTVPKIEFF